MPVIDDEYVERMEEVLKLYARGENPEQPVVCLDERPTTLHADAREPVPFAPGKVAKRDYEYVRRGTANIFCAVEPKTGRRWTRATPNRKAVAYARMLEVIAEAFPRAKTIHLVQDNLNTHRVNSLHTAFGVRRGNALWRRFTLHYTPKHASWLNMAEIEASLVSRECLGKRRIASFTELRAQVTRWRRRASKRARTIDWKFTVKEARKKFRYAGVKTPRSQY